MNFISGLIKIKASFIDDIPNVYQPADDLETSIVQMSTRVVFTAAIIMLSLTVIALAFSKKYQKLRMPLFVSMIITIAASTFTMVGATVYLNTKADSGGPVHWHADIEFWACGNELELRDPTGFLSNKIGTWTLHEHNDQRIHLEGVVVEEEIDASLGKFFHVIGGAITDEQMVIPLNSPDRGELFEDQVDGDGQSAPQPELISSFIIDDEELGRVGNFKSGEYCGDQQSEVQVFVYTTNGDNTYQQQKINNPKEYSITDDSNVPDGDCIIFEFGPPRDQTDKLCEQYGIRDIDRCEEFGVSVSQREICSLKQLGYFPNDYINEEESSTSFFDDERLIPARTACEDSAVGLKSEEVSQTKECLEYADLLMEVNELNSVEGSGDSAEVLPEDESIDQEEL